MNAQPRPYPVPVPSLFYPPPNDTQIGRLLDKRFLQSPVQYWATYPGCVTITQHPLLFVTSNNPSQLNPNFPLPACRLSTLATAIDLASSPFTFDSST